MRIQPGETLAGVPMRRVRDIYGLYEDMPQHEVFVALRNRSAYLSLYSYRDEIIMEGRPHKVIYGQQEYVIPDKVCELFAA